MRKAGVWGRRMINREKWRRRAVRFVAVGRTTRGTERKQKRWTELESHGRRRDRERDVLRYRQKCAPHLLPSQLEKDYAEFRATGTVALCNMDGARVVVTERAKTSDAEVPPDAP